MQHSKAAIGFSSLYTLLLGVGDFGEECFSLVFKVDFALSSVYFSNQL